MTELDDTRSLDQRVNQIHVQLQQNQDRLDVPLDQAIDVLQQLQEFELGRYLLLYGSLNGYWTRYCVVEHPKHRNRAGLHPLESFLLNQNPGFLATQERFTIFQAQTQKRLRDGMVLASVPCGYMDDLLSLDFQGLNDITLVDLDVDSASSTAALQNAEGARLPFPIETHCINAWEIGNAFPASFDLITSNGLNIYVSDEAKEIDLYRNFAQSLKPRGWLIASFMTPPPHVSPRSPWQLKRPDDGKLRKLIFVDILQAKWQNYNTPQSITDKLMAAGFSDIDIVYDAQKIHPTVLARKN